MWQKYHPSPPSDCKPHSDLRGGQAKAILSEDRRELVSSCASYSRRSPHLHLHRSHHSKSLVALLGLRRNHSDRHVCDHAPAQRAHRLVGHGDAPVLSEVANSSSQDRTPRPAIVLPCRLPATPYRASGLVPWHITTGC